MNQKEWSLSANCPQNTQNIKMVILDGDLMNAAEVVFGGFSEEKCF